jgi:ABC-type oligopeptide transport system substrate-binding subunit
VTFLLRAAIALAVLAGAAAPAAAATLTVAGEDDPDSLDPALAYAPESWQVLVNAGEGLLGYRREGGVAGAEFAPPLPSRRRPRSRTAAAAWSSACATTRASGRRRAGRSARAMSRRAWSASS